MFQMDEALRTEIAETLRYHGEDDLADQLTRPLKTTLSGLSNQAEEWTVEDIRERLAEGEPITKQEEKIFAHSPLGEGSTLSSGACLDSRRRRKLE